MIALNMVSRNKCAPQQLTARARAAMMVLAVAGGVGCKDLSGSESVPQGDLYSDVTHTPKGAAQLYVGALVKFQQAMASYVVASGLLADELQANNRGQTITAGNPNVSPDARIDSRNLPDALSDELEQQTSTNVYNVLHGVRAATSEAIGALVKYDPSHSASRRGELYALQAYADVMLADFFCSGVPLSRYNFEGDYTYQPGSPTDSVYTRALALFDSAAALGVDSAPIVALAHVGKARTLLALGRYADAATEAAAVPVAFQYGDSVSTCSWSAPSCIQSQLEVQLGITTRASVSDREGGRGLPYISSADARINAVLLGASQQGNSVYTAAKYHDNGISFIVVADGIEAQLTAAEADLHAGGTAWLGIVNTLRTDGTFTTAVRRDPLTTDSIGVDTTWGLGTGVVPDQTVGVRPLQDPGSSTARQDSLFADRAFWSFGTGRRQGDLRRLVRRYGRNKTTVYPTGTYPVLGAYGQAIDAPIPSTEFTNPLFHGCLNRD